MPADSDPDLPAGARRSGHDLPRVWRPLGARIAGYVAGVGLLLVFVAMWFSFDAPTRQSVTLFQRGTALAMVALGYAVLFALVRSRVVAHPDGLVVVNGFRRHRLVWEQIVAVRLPPGAPWVTLDLADGHTVSAMGIQGSDGERARRAVRELRALVDG